MLEINAVINFVALCYNSICSNYLFALSDGLAAFRSFLQSEFSEENLDFWLACEDYRRIKSLSKMASRAKKIYAEYISIQACKEVGLTIKTHAHTALTIGIRVLAVLRLCKHICLYQIKLNLSDYAVPECKYCVNFIFLLRKSYIMKYTCASFKLHGCTLSFVPFCI